MKNKRLKKYALDLVQELREDVQKSRDMHLPPVDLGDVLAIKPEVLIEPHHTDTVYEEDYLMWKINPDSLKVGDTVILGRDPGDTPIVLGVADGDNEDPLFDPALSAFKNNIEILRENTQHWKPSVFLDDDLPDAGNDDGDLRFSKDTNVIFRWDGDGNTWVAASGAAGNFVPTAGGNMSGDLLMDPGTMITLPDAPVQPTDVVNKAYVDALFALCCPTPLTPTVLIDITDMTPCYAVLPTDQVILCDCSGGALTVCLPAAHSPGQLYEIKDYSGDAAVNNITILADPPDLVDGAATYVMNVNYQAVTVISDGTDWYVF